MIMAKMIQKSTAFERIVHWLLALSCLALLLTGLGFLYKDSLGWLNTLFGGVHAARLVHNWGGIVFAVSLVLSLGTWVPECLKWSSDDSKWLGMAGGYLSENSGNNGVCQRHTHQRIGSDNLAGYPHSCMGADS